MSNRKEPLREKIKTPGWLGNPSVFPTGSVESEESSLGKRCLGLEASLDSRLDCLDS